MGVNKVILVGNLGQDPEIRYTASQMPICNMRVATAERRKGQDGEWAEHTEWHTVVAFGKQAENCGKFLQKGRQVYIEGRIQTRKWQDKEGNNRYSTEVIANTIEFLGGRGGQSESSGDSYGGSNFGGGGSDSSYGGGFEPSSGGGSGISLDDDDIPF